ncbi:aminotransferase class I/II-fold pyridoxal phosphate-dependent enzyme [Salipaludibacillus sp. LMS25]|jgi:arginine/lysine/ornithine decarboxylase|uniref:aminotransferase class I/II-fold pyridoxal phosphate-dependent enzyme n=1 Tax=Salipaludibacillus sp. LMS25 TaxID=2924031 RepID=UPI0020D1CD4A|nr:aminotransferase class I/II-fold pyridoxal phosphate-dependent enzyme [Salipaludibacillus sp. LMS25]UTR16627.1 aminotransferase class I/II-fold pyridoxal phosphate-dependent enzyme [Salipaludibacillus sp. LMS25]
MKQSERPLVERLIKHATKIPNSFHVPGHKNGEVFGKQSKSLFSSILTIDQTEITGLDDLHNAEGVIAEAEKLTAELYGVQSTHFLVAGSTVGNLATSLAFLKRNDKVIVQRNSHQSVFHGIELAGADPIFIEPEKDPISQLALGVSIQTLQEAITCYPEAKAVFITQPSYEGYAQSLVPHVKAAHGANMVICVDEAHGAHLMTANTNCWPESAVAAGADVVIQSAHKTLPAMTMASWLHINSTTITTEYLTYYLRLLQSSSPSYPLMASLDLARAYVATISRDDWKQKALKMNEFKKAFKTSHDWFCASQTISQFTQDPLKVAFITPLQGLPYLWQRKMEENNVYPELVSPHHLLLTLPLTWDSNKTEKWVPFFQTIFQRSLTEKGVFKRRIPLQENGRKKSVSAQRLTFEEMAKATQTVSPWQKSEGAIAAETITPYPPGIPLIIKGEQITHNHLERLADLVEMKAAFQTGKHWVEKGIKIFSI